MSENKDSFLHLRSTVENLIYVRLIFGTDSKLVKYQPKNGSTVFSDPTGQELFKISFGQKLREIKFSRACPPELEKKIQDSFDRLATLK